MDTTRSHAITRVAHPLRFRLLTVARIEPLTPGMRRIVFAGDDLEGFTSLGFDDHVKLFLPESGHPLPTPAAVGGGLRFPEGQPAPPARDFTPRHFDPEARELTIDFGLHGNGPATAWARAARAGDVIGAGGPRGSAIVSDTFDWNLLVGDETALPAIARRLEELPSRVRAVVVVQVDDASEQSYLAGETRAEMHWVHRGGAHARDVEAVVAGLTLPPGEGFAFVAGEASLARRIRRHLIEIRQLDKAWIKAAAYWTAGSVSRHEVITD